MSSSTALSPCKEVNIWQEGCSSVDASDACDPKVGEQRFVATLGQQLFQLTAFEYAPGTNSLRVHNNGLLIDPLKVVELSKATFFLQGEVVLAGAIIVASALTGVTADVEIFINDLSTSEIVLIDGQQEVLFPVAVPIQDSSVYINGPGVDNGRLVEGVQYTANSITNIITLVESYPAGTILLLTYNDTATPTPLVVLPPNTIWYEFATTIGTTQHTTLTINALIIVNYFDSADTPDSAASWRYTGVTTPAKQGNVPDADGHIYDADGKQFAVMGASNVKAFGAVGDGVVDDLAAVNAAIAALSASSHLLFKTGTFALSDSTSALPTGITVVCENAELIKTAGAGNTIFFTTGDNCTFDHVNIDAGEVTPFGSGSQSFGIYGLLASKTTGVEIRGCRFKNIFHAVRIDGGTDWDVHDNFISTVAEGVLCRGSAAEPLKKINVHHNIIDTCDDVAVAFLQQVAGGIVERCSANNNLIFDTNRIINGFALDLESGNAINLQRHVEFCNNIILQVANTAGGITVGNFADGCIVSDNIVIGGYLGQATGINAPLTIDCKILDNHVETFRGNGISVRASTNIHIAGNSIIDCGSTAATYVGIRLVETGQPSATINPLVENNLIKNTIGGVSIGDNAAIHGSQAPMVGNKGYVIRNNRIENFTNNLAIDIDAISVGNEIQVDEISGNSFFNCTSSIGAMRLSFVTNAVIYNNTFIDCVKGIIGDTCTDIQIYCNRIRDNGAAALTDYIVMTLMTNCDLYDNYFSGTITNTVTFTGTGARLWNNQGYFGKTFVTLANEATPTVANWDLFLTGGSNTITDFDDGVIGQIIEVHSEFALTITDGTNIILSGSVNFVMQASDSLVLRLRADNKWYEVSRMVN